MVPHCFFFLLLFTCLEPLIVIIPLDFWIILYSLLLSWVSFKFWMYKWFIEYHFQVWHWVSLLLVAFWIIPYWCKAPSSNYFIIDEDSAFPLLLLSSDLNFRFHTSLLITTYILDEGLCAGLHDSPVARQHTFCIRLTHIICSWQPGAEAHYVCDAFQWCAVRVRESQAVLGRDLFHDSKTSRGFVQRQSVEDGA